MDTQAQVEKCGVCGGELHEETVCFDFDLKQKVCDDCAVQLLFAFGWLKTAGITGCAREPK